MSPRLDDVEVGLVGFAGLGAVEQLGAEEVEGAVFAGDPGAAGEGDGIALARARDGVPAGRRAGRGAAVVVAGLAPLVLIRRRVEVSPLIAAS